MWRYVQEKNVETSRSSLVQTQHLHMWVLKEGLSVKDMREKYCWRPENQTKNTQQFLWRNGGMTCRIGFGNHFPIPSKENSIAACAVYKDSVCDCCFHFLFVFPFLQRNKKFYFLNDAQAAKKQNTMHRKVWIGKAHRGHPDNHLFCLYSVIVFGLQLPADAPVTRASFLIFCGSIEMIQQPHGRMNGYHHHRRVYVIYIYKGGCVRCHTKDTSQNCPNKMAGNNRQFESTKWQRKKKK